MNWELQYLNEFEEKEKILFPNVSSFFEAFSSSFSFSKV